MDYLTRIENAFKLQKLFVSNVSHELKNPLTNITSQLEVTLLNERARRISGNY
jgi:signal transduction histidine kinase